MRTFFTIAKLLAICTLSYGQPCLPGGLTLTTQAEVNAFTTNNPGCTIISGNVQIQGANITNLNGLSNLRQITGDLIIYNNPGLVSISGLGKLSSIGGAVRIQNNDNLPTLQGLDSLRKVQGAFMYISNNTVLSSITALSKMDTVQGIFQIWECPALTSLSGLGNLKYVAGDLAIFRNNNLANLNGLTGLSRITGALRLEDNPVLSNIAALSTPINIQGALVITGNPMLSNCAVSAVCAYLTAPPSFTAFSGNGSECNAASVILGVCATSTSQAEASVPILVFPNPASGIVHIRPGANRISRLQVRDVNGSIVHRAANNLHQLNISHLPAGVYVLEVLTEEGWSAQKLVKH